MIFNNVKDVPPPKDGTVILAMLYRKGYGDIWMASVWYDDDENEWMCEYTDNPFEPTGFHEFNFWAEIKLDDTDGKISTLH